MKEPTRILFISQEIYPYLPEESPMRLLGRKLPQAAQEIGCETRTFMPKFGEINERRNQLHEVIRLSGMNIIIDDTDHPLLIKVASIQSARIQIYFIDNDDFFRRRRGIADPNGVEYEDNDERSIFFVRGVLETVKKLRWTPDIIHCQGWMAALAPLYIKKGYNDTPFFSDSKVVFSLFDQDMQRPFRKDFAEKLVIDGVEESDISDIKGKEVSYERLMQLALDYSDGAIQSSPDANKNLLDYIQKKELPFMAYPGELNTEAYLNFYRSLL